MTKDIDLGALQALAEKATPGPWDYDTHDTPYRIAGGEVVGGDCTGIGEVYTAYDCPGPEDDMPEPKVIARDVELKNGRFMRAANPQTILALIARIRELESHATAWHRLVMSLGCMFDFDASGSTEEVAASASAARDRRADAGKSAEAGKMQQALLQYYEASTALRAADTNEKTVQAIELMNEADKALWILRQDPEKLRRRVEIVAKEGGKA